MTLHVDECHRLGNKVITAEGAARFVKRIRESSGRAIYTNIREAVLAIAAVAPPPKDELKPESQDIQK